jgi:hypothetical protein
MDQLFDVIGKLVVYGGGAVAIAYAVFRFLGEKWIESKFAAQLEGEKHDHAVELQELKKKVDAELSRTIRAQDKEFTVLPEALGLLHDALDKLSILVAVFREQPDLRRMSAPERGCVKTRSHRNFGGPSTLDAIEKIDPDAI